MKLRWKDALEISCPLKMKDSSDTHDIEAGMLTRWDENGIGLLGQIRASTFKDVVRGRVIDGESLSI